MGGVWTQDDGEADEVSWRREGEEIQKERRNGHDRMAAKRRKRRRT